MGGLLWAVGTPGCPWSLTQLTSHRRRPLGSPAVAGGAGLALLPASMGRLRAADTCPDLSCPAVGLWPRRTDGQMCGRGRMPTSFRPQPAPKGTSLCGTPLLRLPRASLPPARRPAGKEVHLPGLPQGFCLPFSVTCPWSADNATLLLLAHDVSGVLDSPLGYQPSRPLPWAGCPPFAP